MKLERHSSAERILAMKRKEKMRTEEFAEAFHILRSRIPVHPKDTKAQKLSRLAILQRASKYISFLGQLLRIMDEEEKKREIAKKKK